MENIPIETLEKESEKIKKDSGLVIYYTETDDLEAEFEKQFSNHQKQKGEDYSNETIQEY